MICWKKLILLFVRTRIKIWLNCTRMRILTRSWKLQKTMRLEIKIFLIVLQKKLVLLINRKVFMERWQKNWKKEFRLSINLEVNRLNRRYIRNSILWINWNKIIPNLFKKIIQMFFKQIVFKFKIQRLNSMIVENKFKSNKGKSRKIWINKFKKLYKKTNS